MRSLTLDVDGSRRAISGPEPAIAVLDLVLREDVDFAIVADETGSYVQCAGTGSALIGEWRHYGPTGFTHYDLRAPSGNSLGTDEMADIVRQFCATGRIGEPFTLDDITTRFTD